MANGLGISGRIVEGETLNAATLGSVSGVHWQSLVNGNWVDIGANGATYVIPTGAAGTVYRVVGTADSGVVFSDATAAATADSRKASAPVLSGPDLGWLRTENAGPGHIFDWMTLSDTDKGNFGGGSLMVLDSNTLLHGGDGNSVLSILFTGGFGYNAATHEISYPGGNGRAVVIGTVDAQLDGVGTNLKVSFNSNATVAIVDALIDHLQFDNNDDSPVSGQLLTLRITDPTGGSAQRLTSVANIATADAPVFSGATSFTADENQRTVGTVQAVDPDREAGTPQGIAYSLADGAGGQDNARFAIDAASGTLSFAATPDYEDPTHAPQYSVRVRATDSEGSVTEQVLGVNLRNVNDAPVAQAATAVAQEDGPAVRITPSFSDADAGDTLRVSFATAGTLGRVAQDGNSFIYDPNGRFESLGAGQSATDSFSYTVTDAAGLASTQTVSVTVQGQNDAATITGGSAAGTIVDGVSTAASGQLSVTDPDQGQSQFAASGGVSSTGLGTFRMGADGRWSYNANSTQLRSLGEGQSVVERYTVASLDGSASRDVAITLQGSNDVPGAFGSGYGFVAEAGSNSAGTPSASGSVQGIDPDANDTLSYSGSAAGQYGSLVVDAASGQWTYTLDNASAATQALRLFDYRDEQFTVTVADSHGASVQQAVHIQVSGSNDAPGNIQGDTAATLHEATPNGAMVLFSGAAQGNYAAATDAAGHLLVLGAQIQTTPDPAYSSGGGSVIGLPDAHVLYRFNPDGTADTSFAGSGALRVSFTYDKFAIDSAGRYVLGEAGGYGSDGSVGTPNDFTVMRYLADGSLDTAFGNNGKTTVDFGGVEKLAQLVALPGGKLLLAGATDASGGNSLAVARLNGDGTLDASFGTAGKLVVSLPGEQTGGYKLVTQADGGVLAWSDVVLQGGSHEVHVIRYDANGSLDTGFGTGGLLDFSLGNWYANAGSAVVTDAAGHIVVGWGQFDYGSAVGFRPMLTRFNADGSLDTTFANGGTADIQVGTRYGGTFGLSVDAQGHFLIAPELTTPPATYGGGDFGLVQVNADGTLDNSFGLAGVARTDVGGEDVAQTVLTLAGGDILLAGHSTQGYQSSLAAFVRYNADGSLEQGFGGPRDEEAYGYLTAQDPDAGAVLSWSGSGNGTYGRFSLSNSGSWHYTVDNSRPATQNLAEGQTVTDTFTATVHDEWGTAATQQVVITIVGSYDPPVS